MGTTAQKLQRVLDTKEGLKDTINTYLGQDITDAIPFKDYETYIKNFYNNHPKTEYQEGTKIILENCLAGKLDFTDEDGIEKLGFGQTKQKSYEGYNVYNPTLKSQTTEGITVTKKEDGTYILNGTCTANNWLDLHFGTNQIDETKNYRITAINSAPEGLSVYATVTKSDGTTEYPLINTATGTTINNSKAVLIFARINSGITLNNIIIKPMVSSDTSKTYDNFEPYVGGTASPNPFYPQKMEVVRGEQEINIGGNNLLKPQELTEITNNGITFTPHYENGVLQYINVNGTATGVATYNLQGGNVDQASTFPNSLSKGEYTLSDFTNFSSAVKAIYLRYSYDNETFTSIFTSTNGANFTLSENAKYATYIRINTGEVINNLKFYPMLIKGSTPSDTYEPYKEPTTHKLSLSNIVYSPTEWQQTNTIQSHNGRIFSKPQKFLKAGKYKVITNLDFNTYCYAIEIGSTKYPYQSNLYDSAWKTINNFEFTAPEGYIGILIKSPKSEASIKPSEMENVTFEVRDASVEDYDYEFASIGDCRDELVYDVDEDKVYKNEYIGKKVVDGTEGTFTKPSTNRFNIDSLITDYYKLVNNITYLSNYYVAYAQKTTNGDFNTLVNNVNYGFDFSNDTTTNPIRIKDTRYDDINQYKAWLSTNNLIIYYIKATPTKTEITGTLKDQIKALYNSQSFNGTTIIEIDGQLPLIIKVRALKGN